MTINLDKWAACIHEAGHIVAVQAAPNQTFESASVWQEGADWRGKTVYADPDYTPAAAPEITTIAVGGKVAETHCFGDFNDAAWDRDFEHLEAEWEKCGKSAGLSVGETFAGAAIEHHEREFLEIAKALYERSSISADEVRAIFL